MSDIVIGDIYISMMNHHFSVITTSFNDEPGVEAYLEAIINQTLPPSEIIIVDGGSKDKTCQKIKDYTPKTSIPILLVEDGRLNIAEAFNIGIRKAHNDYILISCMGNSFSLTMCEDLFNKIKETNADASYGLLLGIDRGDFSKLYNRAFIEKGGNPIMSNRAVMYRKTVFDRIGFFIEKFKYAGEDAEFLNRFNANSLRKALIEKPTVYWETPNSWGEYKKQCKDYAIAELQHAPIARCILTPQMIIWYIIILLVLLFPFSLSLSLSGLVLAVMKLLRSAIDKKSFKVAILCESWTFNKIYFSLKYIKYIFPKNRVTKLSLWNYKQAK